MNLSEKIYEEIAGSNDIKSILYDVNLGEN